MRKGVIAITQDEWLRIGIEKAIIEPENLISSENIKDMNKNLDNIKVSSERNVIARKDGRFMCYAHLKAGRKAIYGKTPAEAIDKAEKREIDDQRANSDEVKYSLETYYKKWFVAKMHTNIRPQTLDRIENTLINTTRQSFLNRISDNWKKTWLLTF